MVGHITTDLFERPAVGVEIVEELPCTVVIAFHLLVDLLRWFKPKRDILPLHMHNIMEVVHESAHAFGDFLLSFADCF